MSAISRNNSPTTRDTMPQRLWHGLKGHLEWLEGILTSLSTHANDLDAERKTTTAKSTDDDDDENCEHEEREWRKKCEWTCCCLKA